MARILEYVLRRSFLYGDGVRLRFPGGCWMPPPNGPLNPSGALWKWGTGPQKLARGLVLELPLQGTG